MPSLSTHSRLKTVIANIEKQIVQNLEKDGLGSIVAGIVVGHELVWAKAVGWADVEQQILATTDSIYRIGSITKTVTVALMMRLAEQGVFRIDDPVEDYFPEVKQLVGYAEHPPLTFRQLASHTSGLAKEPALPNAAVGPIEQWEDKILAAIPTTSFTYRPGERFSYSNIGLGMLGVALSRIARKPYMDLVQSFIFDPLEMKQSCFILTPALQPYLAVGYENHEDGAIDKELPQTEHSGRGYKVPNGGIYTTIEDLARFVTLHTGTSPVQIISAESRAEMQKVHAMETENNGYGLGIRIDILEDGYYVFKHGGAVAGYRAGMAFDPKLKIGVVILRNYGFGEKELNLYVVDLLREIMLAKTTT